MQPNHLAKLQVHLPARLMQLQVSQWQSLSAKAVDLQLAQVKGTWSWHPMIRRITDSPSRGQRTIHRGPVHPLIWLP